MKKNKLVIEKYKKINVKIVSCDFRKVFFNIFLLSQISLIGCQTFNVATRDEAHSQNQQTEGSGSIKSLPIDTVHKANPIVEINEKGEVEAPSQLPTINSQTGNEVNKAPKVGIIIGPGHLRSFISIGILQEFQKAKLPIHAIVGLEWGSIPASIFSIRGQANEAEWQMMKLRYSDLPEKSLLGQAISPIDVSQLNGFFQDALSNVTFDQIKIPFTCLGLDLKNRQYYWMKKGQLSQVISNCVAHPPYFKNKANFVGAVDLKLASDYLKSVGANYIIFINSLPSPTVGSVFDNSNIDFESQAIWGIHQQNLARANNGLNGSIDFVVDTSAVSAKSNDFDQRREMVRKGQEIGLTSINKLSQKIKF